MAAAGGKTARGLVILSVLLSGGIVLGFRLSQKRITTICTIQGKGEISPFMGSEVLAEGIVSAGLGEEIPPGFFLIDPECAEGDTGSGGIFVECDGIGDVVHVGDEVRVAGMVWEVGGETRIQTDPAGIEVLSLGNDFPPAKNLSAYFFQNPNSFAYENWEGQLVFFPESDYLGGFIDPDLPRILPIFDLDPASQMICLKDQSLILQLDSSSLKTRLRNIAAGDLITDLSGIIRQNTSGYVLKLVPGQGFSVVGGPSPSRWGGERMPQMMTASPSGARLLQGTEESTPEGLFTITPQPTGTVAPSPTWYAVNLLISEIYPNPVGKEPDGEWIEIYNPEPYGQPLTAVKIGDETSPAGKEGMIEFPAGYYIEKYEVLVIARQADAFFSEFGSLPDFEMEDSDPRIPDLLPYDGWGRSAVQFSNSGDEVLILDPWDGVVDLLVYGKSDVGGLIDPPPAPGEGHSLERYPPERDRDSGGDWRERENPSPGRLDRTAPTRQASQTPAATGTAPPSPSPTSTEPIGTDTMEPPSTAVITNTPNPDPGGPSATLSQTAAFPSQTSTVTPYQTRTQTEIPAESSTSPVFIPTATPSPPLSSETLEIFPSETIAWQPTGTSTPPGTSSATPSPPPSGTSSPPPAPTASETPYYLDAPEIILNEIHADPDLAAGDANNDGQVDSDDDEFLEFVNTGADEIDLSGWSITDGARTRFTFPEGSVLEGCQAVVIFGGGLPVGEFGTSLVYTAGSLGLNNSGDTITLWDHNGEKKLWYSYGEEGGENQSLTRSPDIIGEPPLVLHSEAALTLGEIFSPGVKLDGSAFTNCP